MKECIPLERPIAAEEHDFVSIGLGLKVISFNEADDVVDVTRKIYEAYAPILNPISGDIQIFFSLAGKKRQIRPLSEPVVNSRKLKRNGKIYIARFLPDIEFPEVLSLSEVLTKCFICKQSVDQNLMRKHRDMCIDSGEISDFESTHHFTEGIVLWPKKL